MLTGPLVEPQDCRAPCVYPSPVEVVARPCQHDKTFHSAPAVQSLRLHEKERRSPMPEDINDEPEEIEEDEDDRKVTLSRSQIRALEKRPKTEDHQKLQRENVLLRLGIDSESPQGQMLMGNTNLEWDKPDSIKAVAQAAGLLPAQQEPGEEAPNEELNQSRERSDLQRGAVGDDGTPHTDPRVSAMDEAKAGLAKGAREEEAMGHFIHQLAEAAQRGDQRVIVR